MSTRLEEWAAQTWYAPQPGIPYDELTPEESKRLFDSYKAPAWDHRPLPPWIDFLAKHIAGCCEPITVEYATRKLDQQLWGSYVWPTLSPAQQNRYRDAVLRVAELVLYKPEVSQEMVNDARARGYPHAYSWATVKKTTIWSVWLIPVGTAALIGVLCLCAVVASVRTMVDPGFNAVMLAVGCAFFGLSGWAYYKGYLKR